MNWFKLHSEFAHDPKLRTFSKAQRYDVICLFCLASESRHRGVILLDDEDIAATIDQDEEEFAAFVEKLIRKSILNRNEDGYLVITNWDARQYDKPSDTPEKVRERVAKHRANKAVSVTQEDENTDVTRCNAPVTPQNRIEKNREEKRESPLTSASQKMSPPAGETSTPPKTTKRFVPPAEDEVRGYMAELGIPNLATKWLAHYAANGWRVGKNPMQDWRAACRTWLDDSRGSPVPIARNGHSPPLTADQIRDEERAAVQRIMEKRGYG